MAKNIVEKQYVDSIVKNVEQYGPYFIIAPYVAMPHSTLGHDGVNATAISFMKTKKPVVFDTNDSSKDATVFFTLAATSDEMHLENMSALSTLLMIDGVIDELVKVEKPEDLLAIEKKYCTEE